MEAGDMMATPTESAKAPTLVALPSLEERASNSLRFLLYVGRLKRLRRTGWVRNGVPQPESVAEHMYRMAMATFLLPPGVDAVKCMKMALVHDLAESLVGDITPHCGIPRDEKLRREREALAALVATLDTSNSMANEVLALWDEFEAATTLESHYVQDADKFEMILQALEYETAYDTVRLPAFFESTEGIFRTSLFQKLDAEVRRLRPPTPSPS